mgnify:CR=1 FL=1
MRILPVYEAQRRVIAAQFFALTATRQHCWLAIMMACATPGIPIDDPEMQAQLAAIWGVTSMTYQRLIA